jgi:hypothetical protein
MGVSQRFVDVAVGAIAREKCHERRPPTRSELGVCPPRPVAPGCGRIPLRDGRPAARNVKFPDRRDQREDRSVIGATVLQSRFTIRNLGRGERRGQRRDDRRHQRDHLGDADMAQAVRFYRALGFEVIYGGDTAGFTSFRAGSGYLNLIAQPAETQWSWWGRVIFYHSDVDALHAAIIAAGYSPSTAPRDAEWGERFFHITDPDEHELSFAWPLR